MARGGGKTRCECGWSAAVCSSDLETYQGVTATITLDKWLSSNGVTTNNTTAHILDGKSITFAATVTNTGTDGLDRKSVVEGKSVALGGRRIIKKKLTHGQSSSYSWVAQKVSEVISTDTATVVGAISDDFGNTATVSARRRENTKCECDWSSDV